MTIPAAATSAWLAIGDLAKRTGVAASALRFYEQRGLITSERNAAGHRRYPRYMARRVAFIVFAQRIGLSLEEVKAELDKLPNGRVPDHEDWARLTAEWNARIEARIRELERLREGLTNCIGCGCLSLDRCQVMNPNDVAAAHGPGPRYWEGDERPFTDADEPSLTVGPATPRMGKWSEYPSPSECHAVLPESDYRRFADPGNSMGEVRPFRNGG